MSRIKPAPTAEQRTARALQSLERAEAEMLRRALLSLSRAQDAYLRTHGGASLEASSAPPPRLRDAEARLDAAMREAARWRAAVDGA